MLGSVRELRTRDKDGLYRLRLEIPEKDFFQFYEDADRKAAEDIIKQFLRYHDDDARPKNVRIDYNRNTHIVSLMAELHYLGNDHTDY